MIIFNKFVYEIHVCILNIATQRKCRQMYYAYTSSINHFGVSVLQSASFTLFTRKQLKFVSEMCFDMDDA